MTHSTQEETVRELAAHLEDHYEETCAAGLSDLEAYELASNEVADWRRLVREIHDLKQEEDAMNNRTWSLWLPGLATGIAAMSTLFLFTRAGFEPRTLWAGSFGWLQLYIPWLVALPLFGALGAYLSRRAEGERTTRVVAALFPSMVMLVVVCLGAAVSIIFDRGLHRPTFSNSVAMIVFNWVLLPGAALLLGALPFLRNIHSREAGEASC
jgi:hypothetical protein